MKKQKAIAALIVRQVIKTVKSVTRWCEVIFWTQKNAPIKAR